MAQAALAREELSALRREIARIEGRLAQTLELPADRRPGVSAQGRDEAEAGATVVRRAGRAVPGLLPLGVAALDGPLGGGLPLAAMTEIHGAQMRDAGCVAGFALGLAALALKSAPAGRPVLWIGSGPLLAEAGEPYMPGILPHFGIAPERMLLCRTQRIEEALWVAEEAAELPALALVLLEVGGASRKLDLVATRRLHRRAMAAGRPLLLLRQAAAAEPTAAPVRLEIAPAPAGERPLLAGLAGLLEGSIGPPAVTVSITRSRTHMPASATLEWSDDAHAFRERAFRAGNPALRTAGPIAGPVGRTPDHGPVASLSQDRPYPAAEMGTGLASGGRAGRAA